MAATLQAIRYDGRTLQLLDQRKLPHESIYLDIPDCKAAWHAIKDMVVRGAPAIAISAALALAVELHNSPDLGTPEAVSRLVATQLEYLVSSRPTAVNLADAADKLKAVAVAAAATEGASAASVVSCVVAEAERMLQADAETNKKIGRHGADAILQAVRERGQAPQGRGLRVLTHCNTGSLACAAYGTALGVIRSLHADGALERAVCTETRPYNQGSRLTAFELVHDGIPGTLIADSAAAYLQATGGVDAVVVGADRVAANGDTANKVGTYALAVASLQHGIPFFVAAPTTSIDTSISSGDSIVIEERDPAELTHALGGRGPQVAPTGINVWNPAFDVTPGRFITGVITELGVAWRHSDARDIDILSFLQSAA